MKKKNYSYQKKILRSVLSIFFLIAFCNLSMAQISISANKTTLGGIINSVKSQTKYQFFYDSVLARNNRAH